MIGQARLRFVLRFALVAVAVLLSVGLVVTFAPSYAARYLVGAELDALGIEYDGLETFEIRPWTRKLRLGPVQFGQQASTPGAVGDLDLTLRVHPLLRRRVAIERLVVSHIEILVTRDADGALALNGIALDELLTGAEESAENGTASGFWTAGVDALELRDSTVVFQRGDGGALEVEVERLVMTDFRAWEPDQPGHFELTAGVNDIQLNWSGEARPFADNITLNIDSRTTQAELPKVIRFTGPLGLDRHEGTYDARLEYEVRIAESGHLDVQATGTIDISGVDYARSGVFALALDQAQLELDLHFTSSVGGDQALKGDISIDVGPTSADLGDQTRLAARGTLAAQSIDAALTQAGALDIAFQPDVDLTELSFSGPLEISVDVLLELLVRLQSLSAAGTLSTADTGLGDLTGKTLQLPPSVVSIDRLAARGERLALRSEDGHAKLDLEAAIELDAVDIEGEQRSVRVKQARGAIGRLIATSGDGLLRVEASADAALATGEARGPLGELTIGGLETQVDDVTVEVRAGALSMQVSASGKGDAFQGLAHAAEGGAQMRLGSDSLSAVLARSSLDIEPGVLGWQAAGDAVAEAVAVSFADGEAGSLEVKHAEISAMQAESPLSLAADTLTLAGLDLSLSRSLLMALVPGGGSTTEAGVDASVARPVSTGPNAVEAQSRRSPAGGDSPKPKIDIRRIQALLAELGYDPGPIDGLMGRRTASAIRSFQTAEGLSVDGRIDAGLLAALERRAEPPAQLEPQPPVQIGAGASPPVEWRLGRLSLPGDPMVRFRDDLVSPNVVVDVRFSRLEAQNLDSHEPGQRALLDVAAEINERTELTLSGWIAGLAAPSELEIQAEVANLQLATYSPYAAAFVGVPLDGGRLNAATDLKAAAGNLEGELRLEIDQIALGSAGEADPQRVGAAGGVPLRTAIDLLADADGRISLRLPITGTVASPDIDIGPAVNKAIGGALKTVFPPTLVASILADLSKGDAPSLDAMEFAPGSATLTQAHRRYADDVAKLAKQRPRLSLKVCGRATAKDIAALETKSQPAMRNAEGRQPPRAEPEPAPVALGASDEQTLHELAVERQRILIAYLIEQAGIDPARISECRANFDPTDQGNPRAEVLF